MARACTHAQIGGEGRGEHCSYTDKNNHDIKLKSFNLSVSNNYCKYTCYP